MSSENSSIDKKSRGTRILPLFGLTLKQNWTTAFLVTIIYFFAFPVPLMVKISEMKKNGYNSVGFAEPLSGAVNWIDIMRYFIVPLTAVLGVVLTCVMLRYLKKKVAVDFYHSLPVSRVKLYFVRGLAGYLAVIVPLAVMLLAGGGILAANDLMSARIAGGLFRIFLDSLVYSLLYYGLAMLVGMISGVTGVHLVLSGIAVFIVPAIYLLNVLFFGLFNNKMWLDWYFKDEKLALLSPVFAFFINGKTSPLYALILTATAAGLLAAGCLVYQKRKSERAGEPIVFAPMRSVVKYLMIYTMTLAVGLLFRYITDSYVWMIFGFVSGAVLTFLLSNTIIFKSAKAMLTGIKGFLVYSACAALFIAGVITDPLGVISSLPDAGNVSHVSIRVGGTCNFVYREKDTIASALAICKEFENQDEADSALYTKNIYVTAIVYPKFGLPVTREFSLWVSDDIGEQLRTLVDSSEFREQYLDMISTGYLTRIAYPYEDNSYFLPSSIHRGNDAHRQALDELHEAMLLDFADVGYDFFNSEPVIGCFDLINCTDAELGGMNVEVPLYASMKNTEQVLLKHGLLSESLETYMETLNDGIESITVCNLGTNERITFTEKEQIRAISKAATLPLNRNPDEYFFEVLCKQTLTDDTYAVVFPTDSGDRYIYLIKNHVPAFIAESFSTADHAGSGSVSN